MDFTFIELAGFSKRRENLLDDDSFREMQVVLIENPELGNIISAQVDFASYDGNYPGLCRSNLFRKNHKFQSCRGFCRFPRNPNLDQLSKY